MSADTTCPDCKLANQPDQFCRFCQQHFGPNTNRPMTTAEQEAAQVLARLKRSVIDALTDDELRHQYAKAVDRAEVLRLEIATRTRAARLLDLRQFQDTLNEAEGLAP